MWVRSRFCSHMGKVCGLVALTGLGCASVPTTPGGPLQRAGTVQIGGAEIIDASRIAVTTTSSMTGMTSSEEAWRLDAGTMAPPFPSRLGGRIAMTDWLDGEADWGWSGVGGELRAGVPEVGQRLPFALSVGARSAILAPIVLDDRIREQREVRLRLEMYPLLAQRWEGPGDPFRFHAIVALGVSRGRHFHAFNLETKDELNLLRDEDRVEAVLGGELRVRRASFSLVAMPYYVTDASAPTALSCGIAHCAGVTDRTLGSFSQSYGVSVVVSLGYAVRQ